MDRLPLRYGPAGATALVRELCGHDEESVEDASTRTAIALLDRLLVASSSAVGPGRAAELCAADRDRVLAAVYLRAYGDAVASTVTCSGCGTTFNLDFSLGHLVQSLEPSVPAVRQADGTWLVGGERRLRLPTGADEVEVAALPPAQAEQLLRARCAIDGDGDDAALLDAVAPIVDVELDASCPECAQTQPVHFDVQGYLLARLIGERRQRVDEVHRIASAYGWSRREILELPRATRRTHVELITRDGGARWRAI